MILSSGIPPVTNQSALLSGILVIEENFNCGSEEKGMKMD